MDIVVVTKNTIFDSSHTKRPTCNRLSLGASGSETEHSTINNKKKYKLIKSKIFENLQRGIE